MAALGKPSLTLDEFKARGFELKENEKRYLLQTNRCPICDTELKYEGTTIEGIEGLNYPPREKVVNEGCKQCGILFKIERGHV